MNGSGIKTDPYLITDITDWNEIENHNGQRYYYRLENDIDFNYQDTFAISNFSGYLDGNYKRLKYLNIISRGNNKIGLFETIIGDGQDNNIQNLEIFSASFAYTDQIHYMGYLSANASYAHISNVHLIECNNYNNLIAESYTDGGLGFFIGVVDECTIVSSSVRHSTYNLESVPLPVENLNFGGFVGNMSNSTINSCYSNSDIYYVVGSDVSSVNVGGFVGYVNGATSEILNCHSNGTITVSNSNGVNYNVGGFAGKVNNSNLFENCYSNMELIADSNATYLNGFVGYSVNDNYNNCFYNMSKVLQGMNTSYVEISGRSDKQSNSIVRLPDEEMKFLENYTEIDNFYLNFNSDQTLALVHSGLLTDPYFDLNNADGWVDLSGKVAFQYSEPGTNGNYCLYAENASPDLIIMYKEFDSNTMFANEYYIVKIRYKATAEISIKDYDGTVFKTLPPRGDWTYVEFRFQATSYRKVYINFSANSYAWIDSFYIELDRNLNINSVEMIDSNVYNRVLELNGNDEYLQIALPNNLATGNTNDWTSSGTKPTGWNQGLGTFTWNDTQTGSTGTYVLKIVNGGPSSSIEIPGLIIGKKYKIKLRAKGNWIGINDTQGAPTQLTISSEWNYISRIITAYNTSLFIQVSSGTTYIDIISIKEDQGFDLNKDQEQILHSKNWDFERTLGAELASGTVTIGSKYIVTAGTVEGNAVGTEFLAVTNATTLDASNKVKPIPNLATATFINKSGAAYDTFTGASATGFTAVEDTTLGRAVAYQTFGFQSGKRYRFSYTITVNAFSFGIGLFIGDSNVGTQQIVNHAATGTSTVTYDVTANAAHGYYGFRVEAGQTADFAVSGFHFYEIPEWTATGNHTCDVSTLDKSSGTQSLKVTATGTGSSSINFVNLAYTEFDGLAHYKKYILEFLARPSTSDLNLTIGIGANSKSFALATGSSWITCMWNIDNYDNSFTNQDIKLWLNNSGSVWFDNLRFVQNYDIALITAGKFIRNTSYSGSEDLLIFGSETTNSSSVGYGLSYDNNGGLWGDFVDNNSNILTVSASIIQDKYYDSIIMVKDSYRDMNTSSLYIENQLVNMNYGMLGLMDIPYSDESSINPSHGFKGWLGRTQLIRFDNISYSNFNPTTYRIGDIITGGGAEIVAYYTWKDAVNETTFTGYSNQLFYDKSNVRNDLSQINIDISNIKSIPFMLITGSLVISRSNFNEQLVLGNGYTLEFNAYASGNISLPMDVTASIGTATYNWNNISYISSSASKLYYNFVANNNTINQDMIFSKSVTGVLNISDISLTQAYDMTINVMLENDFSNSDKYLLYTEYANNGEFYIIKRNNGYNFRISNYGKILLTSSLFGTGSWSAASFTYKVGSGVEIFVNGTSVLYDSSSIYLSRLKDVNMYVVGNNVITGDYTTAYYGKIGEIQIIRGYAYNFEDSLYLYENGFNYPKVGKVALWYKWIDGSIEDIAGYNELSAAPDYASSYGSYESINNVKLRELFAQNFGVYYDYNDGYPYLYNNEYKFYTRNDITPHDSTSVIKSGRVFKIKWDSYY